MEQDKHSGLGVTGVLLILFIILKLFNVIAWSWLWVLSPLWISLVIYGALEVWLTIIAIKRINKG